MGLWDGEGDGIPIPRGRLQGAVGPQGGVCTCMECISRIPIMFDGSCTRIVATISMMKLKCHFHVGVYIVYWIRQMPVWNRSIRLACIVYDYVETGSAIALSWRIHDDSYVFQR